ncbi:MAG: sulfite exporter TauE/SafE family protein [Planctomycetota bacterium]
MIALLVAVFSASLLGSLHCAGMCGGIVALCSRRGGGLLDQLAYHGARGSTYVLAGALAGAVGGALDLGGRLLGLQRAVAWVTGAALIAVGAAALWRACGLPLPRSRGALGARLQGWIARAVSAGADLPPRTHAALLGLLTPLLPCGWLYVFVLAAGGTANPLQGAAVMAAFWLGTVPILFALALGLRALADRLRGAAPVLGGLVLIAVGALLIAERARLSYVVAPPAPAAEAPPVPHDAPCCTDEAPAPVVPTRAPCCGEAGGSS